MTTKKIDAMKFIQEVTDLKAKLKAAALGLDAAYVTHEAVHAATLVACTAADDALHLAIAAHQDAYDAFVSIK